ncbi:MAG: phenylalanine--tRNA ligase subunit beta [Candidatus Hydrogenedens sp.]|nr:phenylalanine--tRNA ligase subunit beta [Candidatus Hydrogenedens sp.]
MKISLNWLKEYVDIPVSPEQLAEDLTSLGLEIESMERLAEGIEQIVIGRILEIAPHPDADKIVVCQTDVGGDTPLQICCGAKNMKPGDKVPTAVVGATLPGDFKITARKMRGVDSHGMMCSARELGMGDDHAGLMILPEDAPVGEDALAYLGLDDVVYEIEVTPNRADWASMIGVARELAAKYGTSLKVPAVALQEAAAEASSLSSASVDAPDLCPRYMGRVLTEVQVGASPVWMAQRLTAAGMRPINNLVDITNYVLLETGQPLHAFDFDRLDGNRIVVRRAADGEKMTTLDEQERTLDGEMLVIADASRPQCVAGVMGGARSEVGEGTTRVFLESAYFKPQAVRRASRQLNLISESSQRFQRGADPEMAAWALDRAAALMAEFAGASIASGAIDVYPEPFKPAEVDLNFERVRAFLGADISVEKQRAGLQALGFELISGDESGARFRVPLRRNDVSREVDLIEEIARLEGYNNLPATLPRVRTRAEVFAPGEAVVSRIKHTFAAQGLNEITTWSFANAEALAKAGQGDLTAAAVSLANPLSEIHALMRPTLIPAALQIAAYNLNRGARHVALFELAPVYREAGGDDVAEQRQHLVVLLAGLREPSHWTHPDQPVDFYDIKGAAETLANLLGLPLQIASAEGATFQPGQAASLTLGDACGVLGKVDPAVAAQHDIEVPVFLLQLDLTPVLAPPSAHHQAEEIPAYPASLRDIAVVVDQAVTAADILDVVKKSADKLLAQADIFDVYTGKPIPEGKKSVAVTLSFQSNEGTLTDKKTQKAVDRILHQLQKNCGAELR